MRKESILFVFGCLLFTLGCSFQVEYRVEANEEGTFFAESITYDTNSGEKEVTNVELPWSFTFEAGEGDFVSCKACCGDLNVYIFKDGRQVAFANGESPEAKTSL